MKAIIWTKYGPPEVLQLQEVEQPTPQDDEVLIRVHASTVTAGDCEMRSLRFPIILGFPMRLWIGLFKPRGKTIPGTEFAGVIEAVGKDVESFNIGDEVFGSTGMRFGANAQYVCLPGAPGEMEGSVAIKPSNMNFEEAATVPFGARDALHFLRLADLKHRQKILINGAGGSIGTFAVQLAKLDGVEVTAVDSGEKLDMLRSLGADHLIDYTREDFTESNVTYDVIFDVVGTIRFSRGNKVLKEKGIYLLANPVSQLPDAWWTRLTTNRQVRTQTASGGREDLDFLRELIETGRLRTVIDRAYPLEDIVEAHRYVETGAKQGNVVLIIDGSSTSKG